jgi:hypothetical protein
MTGTALPRRCSCRGNADTFAYSVLAAATFNLYRDQQGNWNLDSETADLTRLASSNLPFAERLTLSSTRTG